MYMMIGMDSFAILLLYFDDIFLVSNDINLLIETKYMLLKYFEMKDLRNALFVLGIEIQCDKSNVYFAYLSSLTLRKY